MFALPLELGRVLRDLGPARSILLEQRSHVHESFDVQQVPVDLAWPREVSSDHGLGVAPVGSGIASSQTTANAEPSLDNAVGTAPVEVGWDTAKRPEAPSISWIVVADQALSVTVPVWPSVVVADAFVNFTVPKSVKGSCIQRPDVSHADGASATHSADEVSGVDMRSVFVNFVLRVRFLICKVTEVPVTFTDALITLPGKTLNLIGTLAAGTSSYHMEYVALPVAVQSAEVPICSSACELSEKPPRPTQKAEYVERELVQLAVG
jgi:hypothetical protein